MISVQTNIFSSLYSIFFLVEDLISDWDPSSRQVWTFALSFMHLILICMEPTAYIQPNRQQQPVVS